MVSLRAYARGLKKEIARLQELVKRNVEKKPEKFSIIYELTQPGTWLDYADGDWAFAIQGLLGQLENTLADAALALTLFEQERRKPSPSFPNQDQWEADAKKRKEIEDLLIFLICF